MFYYTRAGAFASDPPPGGCAGEVVLSAPRGSVSDGWGEYRSANNCTWHIVPPGVNQSQGTREHISGVRTNHRGASEWPVASSRSQTIDTRAPHGH
eukprot:4894083-Pyramimonas_sp.AAC.1